MNTETETGRGSERFEVFVHEVEGWAVRRVGETEPLTRHDSREQAEKAARLHATEQIGAEIRQEIFTNDPEQAVRRRRAPIVLGVATAVLVLIAIAAIIGPAG